MKKMLVVTVAVLVLLISNGFARSAVGSPFGAMATATTLGMGMGTFGLSVGLADMTSVTGSFTYGLSAHTDGRIRIGLVDADNADTKIGIGADFRYQLLSVTGVSNGPFDMALGAFTEYYDLGTTSALLVGGQVFGSYPVKLKNNTTLSPYGRFNMRLESISYDADIDSDSNLEVGLNGGVEWKLSKNVALFGEFQIDGNDGVFFGIDISAL